MCSEIRKVIRKKIFGDSIRSLIALYFEALHHISMQFIMFLCNSSHFYAIHHITALHCTYSVAIAAHYAGDRLS